MSQTTRRPRTNRTTHPVDEVLPVPKLALYGFQHVLAFYAGAVIVPILLAGALMESYPDLASIVDEEDDVAIAANEHSLVDQSAAGLTHLGEEDQTAFGELTTAYRDRFESPQSPYLERRLPSTPGWQTRTGRATDGAARGLDLNVFGGPAIAQREGSAVNRSARGQCRQPLSASARPATVESGSGRPPFRANTGPTTVESEFGPATVQSECRASNRCERVRAGNRSERVQGQQQVHPVLKPGQVPSRQLLDARDAIPHRVDVQDQLGRGPRP